MEKNGGRCILLDAGPGDARWHRCQRFLTLQFHGHRCCVLFSGPTFFRQYFTTAEGLKPSILYHSLFKQPSCAPNLTHSSQAKPTRKQKCRNANPSPSPSRSASSRVFGCGTNSLGWIQPGFWERSRPIHYLVAALFLGMESTHHMFG